MSYHYSTISFSAHNLLYQHGDHVLFSDISFALRNGDALIVEGQNGCGKSTLLRSLTGLTTLREGVLSWNHQSIEDDMAEYRRAFHYVGHQNGLKLDLTVAENINLFLSLHTQNLLKPPHVATLLYPLSLQEISHLQACVLSAGQRRRVALAKLFLVEKPLWILDEPFTSLDAESNALLLTHIKHHLAKGGITILSSHHAIDQLLPSPHLLRLPHS